MRNCLQLVLLVVLFSSSAQGTELRVAVASNFAPIMSVLADQFTANSGHQLVLIPGSTGKHYAQIVNGAPFDAFLAADADRPRLLEEQGFAVADTRFTYALGQLVLWSKQTDRRVEQVLAQGAFQHLAIANPRLAPYGRAAQQVLQSLELEALSSSKLVRGENIAQTFQFVSSGNAELGFVALSQIKIIDQGSHWIVPTSFYQPIEQQAIMLKDSEPARLFFDFMRSPPVLTRIREYGYAVQ